MKINCFHCQILENKTRFGFWISNCGKTEYNHEEGAEDNYKAHGYKKRKSPIQELQ